MKKKTYETKADAENAAKAKGAGYTVGFYRGAWYVVPKARAK